MRGKGSSRRRPRLRFFLTLPERARRARAVSGRCGEGREGEGERSNVDGRMNVSIRARAEWTEWNEASEFTFCSGQKNGEDFQGGVCVCSRSVGMGRVGSAEERERDN